jgi:hypothetical protein
MLTFFCGWKRKVGVVTLVMVCVLALGWLRSFDISDQLNSSLMPNEVFQSACGGVRWYSDARSIFPNPSLASTWSVSTSEWRPLSEAGEPVCIGFHFDQYEDGSISIGIPYWSLVIPMTAVSAYLLLSKPTTPKQPEQQSI